MDVQRKSERSNKGIPPTRFGFENYGLDNFLMQNKPEVGAFGDINSTPNYGVENPATQNEREDGACGSTDPTLIEKTMIRGKNIMNQSSKYAKSIVSKANSKTSKRSSIREVAHLKKTMEREAEIYEIDMLALKKKKEFLLRAQQLENELKQQEDKTSNNGRVEDDDVSESDDEERKKNIDEWVNKIESPFRFESMDSPPNNNRHHQQIFESTRQNQLEHSVRNDVLIAAFKALQTKEIKDLPTFDGDNVLEWPNFISEFRRSTAEYDIKPSKNLRRLNKALEGDARSSVQTLLTSPDNIKEIISHLEMSFGRKEWILQHLIFELRSLPIMDVEEDIHEFKLFYNKLFGAITTIKNVKAENYMGNPELLACLEDKLPPTTKNYWIHHKAHLIRNNTKVNIAVLGEWFKYELDAQYAGLSAKDVIKKNHKVLSDNHDASPYIADGKDFP